MTVLYLNSMPYSDRPGDFQHDERAVSKVIGAVLIFGILVVSFSLYQAYVIPSQNAQTEFNHVSDVRSDIIQAHNGIVSVAGTDGEVSRSIEVGTTYQSRLLGLNPPPPTGRLQPHAEGNLSMTLDNGSVTLSDVCGGGVSTKGFGYEPDYNEFNAQPVVYENGQVYVDGEAGHVFLTERPIIDIQNETIRLYRLVGQIPTKQGLTSVTLNVKGAETYGEAENVDIDIITVPSELSEEDWQETLISDPNARLNGVSETNDGVEVDLPDASYTIECYSIGVEDRDFSVDVPDRYTPSDGNGITDVGESDVGESGESTYTETESATLSAKGGLWTDITGVNALNISNPRFSPTRAGDGELKKEKWSLRTVLSVETAGSDTQYFIDVGEKKGLQFDAGDENPEWENRDLTIIRREPDGEDGWEITKAETKIDDDALSLKEFRDDTVFNPLNLEQIEADAESDYADFIYEMRKTLNSSSDSELFVADQHGRVLAALDSTEYPTATGNEFLAADDGGASTKPKAVKIESGPYSGAKIGIINTRDDPIDAITDITVTVTSSDKPTSVSADAYDSRDRDSYGSEVYFDGDTEGYINESFDLGQTKSFSSEGNIDDGSSVVLKFSEFTDETGDPVDMEDEQIELKITFKTDGDTYTDTIRATLNSTTTT
jgi:hypothetical protein